LGYEAVSEVSDFKNNRAHEEWFSTIGLPNGFFTDFTDFTDLKYQKNIAPKAPCLSRIKSGQPRLSSKAWGDALVSEVSEKAGLEIGLRGGQ